MSKLAWRTLPLVLSIACSPETGELGETDTSTSGGSSSAGEASSSSSIGADETAETGTAPADPPARGVRISLVEVNAGVAITVGRDGAWVDGDGRNGPIPRNRDTAFRVRVDVDETDWVARELEARLVLHQLDGTMETFSAEESIAADSDAADDALGSTFMIVVPAASMLPFVQFEVELYETGPTGWGHLPEPAAADPRLPADGPAFVGVEDGEQTMRVMLVPVQYESASCTATFDTSPEVVATYVDAMLQHNPLERVELEIHAPYVVNDLDLADANDFFTLLERMQQLRAAEQPDPNVYYYGIFDNCAQCVGFGGLPGCVLGVAAGLPDDSMGSAVERVAIGASELDSPEAGGLVEGIGISTFVHEIGHTQGRQHVACPGVQAGGPDPTYPYAEGKIGVWGWGTLDAEIRVANEHTDYMSYCSPTWVSDWQWSATFQRIRTLSSWDAASMGALDRHAVLVGSIDPEAGTATWWTDRGWLTEATTDHRLRYLAGDETLAEVPVQVSAWSEGPRLTVRAPLHAAFAAAEVIELSSPGRTYRAPRAAVEVYHQPATLTGR